MGTRTFVILAFAAGMAASAINLGRSTAHADSTPVTVNCIGYTDPSDHTLKHAPGCAVTAQGQASGEWRCPACAAAFHAAMLTAPPAYQRALGEIHLVHGHLYAIDDGDGLAKVQDPTTGAWTAISGMPTTIATPASSSATMTPSPETIATPGPPASMPDGGVAPDMTGP